MLRNDFYSVSIIHSDGSSTVDATLLLNDKHAIFDGHFPGQPVVPGVCMLQMITECLEQAVACKLRLTAAAAIKFLSVLVPEPNKKIRMQASFIIGSDVNVVTASLSDGNECFIKLNNACYHFS